MRRIIGGALLLALVACSGGNDDDAAPVTTTTTASTTTTTVATTTSSTELSYPDEPPTPATDPTFLAKQIIQTERDIRRAEVRDEYALAMEAHIQQVAYRTLAAHPEWDLQVRSLLPDDLIPVVDANVAAGRELRALVKNPRPNLPAWRIVKPEPRQHLLELYEAAEAEFGVPWQYLAGVHLTETRMGRIRGTSTAGAKGPMQFLPSTWEAYGEGDIEDTGDAIRAAARYLKANGAPERMADALYRYNPTSKYVNAVTAYAEQMVADPTAYNGYYYWQVYYWSTLGDVWLREGYEATEERPVTPDDL